MLFAADGTVVDSLSGGLIGWVAGLQIADAAVIPEPWGYPLVLAAVAWLAALPRLRRRIPLP